MMRDNAVAPVIAAMLVLAVIVTFFAVWNATAIPSMKAQAEVSHLHEVEEGMLRFSSDIDAATSMPTNMKLSERIPLGGGDILYSATKSGGMLAVQGEEPYMKIEITMKDSPFPTNKTFYLSNISYQPTGNFWQDQGYVWSHGYVSVIKGNQSVPLDYSTMQDVKDKNYDNFPQALFSLGVESYDDTQLNCSILKIKGVDIRPSASSNSTSGNGVGVLALNSTVKLNNAVKKSGVKYYNISKIQINTSVSATLDPDFEDAMYNAVNTSLNDSKLLACSKNIKIEYAPSDRLITITVIGDHNVTVRRQTTTILIGTQ